MSSWSGPSHVVQTVARRGLQSAYSFVPFYTRLATMGVGVAGQRIVDVGTGTGVLARGFAAAGCVVTGVDIAPELLDQARQQDAGQVTYLVAPAEDAPDFSGRRAG